MALVQCGECNAEVSDKAQHCIKCGAPISAEGLAAGAELVTTQETSKKLKKQSILSVSLLFLGLMIGLFATQPPANQGAVSFGLTLFVVGAVWQVITRIRTWWHHG